MFELKSHPALVIIDMQNGFCHPQGTCAKLGISVQNQLEIVPTINKLRSRSHASNIPVFYLYIAYNENYSDAGVLYEEPGMDRWKKGGFIRGTWDTEILDDLKPDVSDPNEIVIEKTRTTGFWRTELESQLRSRGINQLLLTGVGTNVCVESTARDAVTYGFFCKTIRDATATLTEEEHEASLKTLDHYFGGVASSAEVLEALDKRHEQQ